MTKVNEKKEEKELVAQEPEEVETKEEPAKKDKKNIVIKETEEDIVLGTGFTGDPEDFKEEIRREAEKGGFMTKYVLPLFFVIFVACASAGATWYYSKPERSIEAEVKAEDKIETPPAITETPTETPAPVPAPEPEKKETSYTVQEGDTMSGIANKYDMTSSELATYNNLTDVNSLHIGQVLKIPVK